MPTDETTHKQKFKIDEWPTNKVTIFPTRAVISRQIEKVELHPGLNEITITDLTSLADQDSIRVSGKTNDQPTRINDLTVDLIRKGPFRAFGFVSPNASDSEEEEEEEDEKPQSYIDAQKALDGTTKRIYYLHERRIASDAELNVLKAYVTSLSTNNPEASDPATMKDAMALYSTQRKAHQELCIEADEEMVKLEEERAKHSKLLTKETKAFQKSNKAKVEARTQRKQEKATKKQEAAELKPKTTDMVYQVRITVDLPSTTTDTSPTPTTLTLTYTTSAATWSPHYDLLLDTTSPTLSTLTYRAHFINRTYETWTNALITLSTSQAAFGGLNEKVPQMHAWKVTSKKGGEGGLVSLAEKALQEAERRKAIPFFGQQTGFQAFGVKQPATKPKPTFSFGRPVPPPSVGGFGNSAIPAPGTGFGAFAGKGPSPFGVAAPVAAAPTTSIFGSSPFGAAASQTQVSSFGQPQPQQQQQNVGFGAFGSTPAPQSQSGSGLFGANTQTQSNAGVFGQPQANQNTTSSFGGTNQTTSGGLFGGIFNNTTTTTAPAEDTTNDKDDSDATSNLQTISTAESYGLTTTYDLPTPRTIPSSHLTRRHVIAELTLPQLVFSHIIIPKLKPGAFLKARLTNTSNVPLLPGPAGLTLDGSFLGHLSFPRCSPEESTTLELGVDTGVKVEYSHPTVKRQTQGGGGLFGGGGNKESVGGFKRGVRVSNAKGVGVRVVVLDQVPVPEEGEEGGKVKVEVVVPKGLREVGDVVSGVGVDGVGKKAPAAAQTASSKKLESILQNEKGTVGKQSAFSPSSSTATNGWGTAKATYVKDGEIRWDVELNKGSCVSLGLEWECRVPDGEVVHSLS